MVRACCVHTHWGEMGGSVVCTHIGGGGRECCVHTHWGRWEGVLCAHTLEGVLCTHTHTHTHTHGSVVDTHWRKCVGGSVVWEGVLCTHVGMWEGVLCGRECCVGGSVV